MDATRTISFVLFREDTGALLTTATPTFVEYANLQGQSMPPFPPITNLGGGRYGFTPSQEQYNQGIVYLVSCGTNAAPQWVSGAVGGEHVAFALYNPDTGLLLGGAQPVFLQYEASEGAALMPPSITELFTGVYCFLPTGEALDGRCRYLIHTPGATPEYFQGELAWEGRPKPRIRVEVVSPLPGAEIQLDEPMVFRLLMEHGARAPVVCVYGERSGTTEVAHDGSSFLNHYLRDSSMRVVEGGYEYTLARHGGWPPPGPGGVCIRLQLFSVDGSLLEV